MSGHPQEESTLPNNQCKKVLNTCDSTGSRWIISGLNNLMQCHDRKNRTWIRNDYLNHPSTHAARRVSSYADITLRLRYDGNILFFVCSGEGGKILPYGRIVVVSLLLSHSLL